VNLDQVNSEGDLKVRVGKKHGRRNKKEKVHPGRRLQEVFKTGRWLGMVAQAYNPSHLGEKD
jgi:hypothetical protein